MREVRHKRSGFSLIELLVVIAMIALLAALLFPVFQRVREQTKQATCMDQLRSIQHAVALYYLDNNKYPPTLYGYAEQANGSLYTGSGQPVPMGSVRQKPLFLSQKYLTAKEAFFCPDNVPQDQNAVTPAVFPLNTPLADQTVKFQNGQTAYFYTADSYDVGPRVDKDGNVVKQGGGPVMELHYSLYWTQNVGPGDNKSQLKYPNPPATETVLTWCTYHVATAHANVIPIIMLNGTAKSVPVQEFVTKGPLNYKF